MTMQPAASRLILVLLGMLLLTGCSGSDSTTPSETPPLATATIGADGGNLTTDNASIEFPANALTDDTEVQLYAEDDLIGDQGITDSIRIGGLPTQVFGHIAIRLRYTGELDGDSYILIGRPYVDPLTELEQIQYTYLAAADSSGFLYAELTAEKLDLAKRAADPVTDLIFFAVGITGQLTRYSPEPGPPDPGPWHFRITYDKNVVSHMDQLVSVLEEVYAIYLDLGFDFTWSEHPFENVEVQVLDEDYSSLTSFHVHTTRRLDTDFKLVDYQLKIFEPALVTMSRDSMLMDIGREFYYPVSIAQTHNSQNFRHFFTVACRSWMEQKFTTEPDHVPHEYAGSEAYFLKGLDYSFGIDYEASSNYWNSAPVLIKYFCDTYGEAILPAILLEQRDHDVDVIDAIASVIPDPTAVWWPALVNQLVQGELYAVDVDNFLADLSGTATYTTAADTLSTFTENYNDWSAKIFRINLENDSFDESAVLRLNTVSELEDQFTEILLYGLDDGELTYYTRGDNIILTDIAALQEDGIDVIAIVVCANAIPPYEATTGITLEVRATAQLAYDLITVRLYYEAQFEGEADPRTHQGLHLFGASGTLAGNTFTAQWDSTSSGVRKHGSASCTIDWDTPAVTSWTWENTWDYLDSDAYNYYTASGGSLPLYGQYDSYVRFSESGENVCDNLSNVSVEQHNGDEFTSQLESFTCNSQSSLEVRFDIDDKSVR